MEIVKCFETCDVTKDNLLKSCDVLWIKGLQMFQILFFLHIFEVLTCKNCYSFLG